MRAERLWIHHTEEIQGQLTGTSLCMTGVVFSLFFGRAKAGAKQARGAGRVFPSRACLTLLARFALAFVRLKNAKTITPVLICSFNIITGHWHV